MSCGKPWRSEIVTTCIARTNYVYSHTPLVGGGAWDVEWFWQERPQLADPAPLCAHGQQHGLGSHWDVWMTAKATGSMTALEIASVHGARFLGVDADIGSITVGKLADLMVLNTNPLDNILNTVDLRYVMKAGVLYDANSLDELWPRARPCGNTPWYRPEMFTRDTKKVER